MESLKVKVENLGKLKRKITVSVPQSKVRGAYEKCFLSLQNKVKVNGFRPGKYPRSFLEKRFQKVMKNEAIETLVPEYFDQALKQEDLEPVGRPNFSDLEIDKNKPLVFSADFEIFAKFEMPDYSSFSLEKEDVEPTKEEFNRQKLAHLEQSVEYTPKDGAAEARDQVVVDYEGRVDEKSIEKKENYSYIIDSKLMLPEFEEALKGMKKDEEKNFSLVFPADYRQKDLQNKTANFFVKVQEVKKRGELPEINQEFLAKYGEQVKTEEDFEKFIKDEVRFTNTNRTKQQQHQSIKEQLANILDFDIPEQILNEEINIKLGQTKQKAEYKDKSEEELKKEVEKQAIEQIRFSIFIKKILEKENIQPDKDKVQRRFHFHAMIMGADPNDLIKEEVGKQIFQEAYGMEAEEAALNFMVNKIIK